MFPKEHAASATVDIWPIDTTEAILREYSRRWVLFRERQARTRRKSRVAHTRIQGERKRSESQARPTMSILFLVLRRLGAQARAAPCWSVAGGAGPSPWPGRSPGLRACAPEVWLERVRSSLAWLWGLESQLHFQSHWCPPREWRPHLRMTTRTTLFPSSQQHTARLGPSPAGNSRNLKPPLGLPSYYIRRRCTTTERTRICGIG
jgi:hypothetical protein